MKSEFCGRTSERPKAVAAGRAQFRTQNNEQMLVRAVFQKKVLEVIESTPENSTTSVCADSVCVDSPFAL